MDHLWRSAPASLAELLDVINATRPAPITRPTLQTQLTRLENKGWIKRNSTSRTHLYEPAVAETPGRKTVLSDLKRRFFGGSKLALMRCLVDSGEITETELAELSQLIHSARQKKTGGS